MSFLCTYNCNQKETDHPNVYCYENTKGCKEINCVRQMLKFVMKVSFLHYIHLYQYILDICIHKINTYSFGLVFMTQTIKSLTVTLSYERNWE